MDPIAARTLLQRYLEGDATQDEIIIIEQWYQELVDAGEWSWAEGEKEQLEAVMEERLLRRIEEGPEEGASGGGRVISWRRIGVAAAVLLLIAAAYLLYNRKSPIASAGQRYRNEAMPGRNAAVLTLADGKTVLLGDSAPHMIGQQGGVDIVNDSGQLVYQARSGKPAQVFYNTLTTQKGNQYHLVLPDGTKVWLNAVSSLTYPTYFTGTERRVVVSGEAYFEVAKNEHLPFIVQQGDMKVQVLGTSFDVNGYGDEGAQKATLLKGKIRVGKGTDSSLLMPGQQAVIDKNSARISIVKDPDLEAVMAWKNGSFTFNDTGLESIMRQVERWYDVQVIYEAKINKHFHADVPRNVPLSKLLKLLETTGQVRFRIEGKKVIVMP